MKTIQFSMREKILLALLIFALFSYSYYRFVFLPLHEEKQQLVVENQYLQTVLQQNTELNQQMINGGIEIEKLRKEYEVLAHKLPAQPYIPETITFLDKAAQEKKVVLVEILHNKDKNTQNVDELQSLLNSEKINVDATAKENKPANSNVAELEFALKSRGTFFAVMSYLMEIENYSRLYVPERLFLQAGKKSLSEQQSTQGYVARPSTLVDSNNITMELDLIAFYDQQGFEDTKDIDIIILSANGKDNPFAK